LHDQLLGSTQPVLSISLEPGESIVAGAADFAWMTDSIQMSASAGRSMLADALRQTLCSSSVPLSVYTATQTAGTIAFASRLPGSIVSIAVTPGSEFLVHRRGFLAGTPGIEITTGFRQQLPANGSGAEDFILQRIGGHGHAWVELSGDVITRELAVGVSLRTHPWHIGMCGGSVAVQMAEYDGIANRDLGSDSHHFAVLSGPGIVWLQSMPLLAAEPRSHYWPGRDSTSAATTSSTDSAPA
jgi:uncharacterized protein (AIM24 family)